MYGDGAAQGGQEMLTMDEYDLIRRKHLVDGMSQRAIAQELGYARNTVARAKSVFV